MNLANIQGLNLAIAKSAQDRKLEAEIMTGADILRMEGRAQGQLIGQINFAEEMLGRVPTPPNTLAFKSPENLQEELASLRSALMQRNQSLFAPGK